MKFQKWLENWDMTSLKINLKFLEMEWKPNEPDMNAAWELYIELLTRVSTQRLDLEHGDEATALGSIFKLFDLTRTTIKKYGRECSEFSKIAIVVLNQIIRPFTAKWHKVLVSGGFSDKANCEKFREELDILQGKLRTYTKMLADMASVEDLTSLECEE